MLAVVTAEIVIPAVCITATAIVGCILAWLDKREAVNEADKMGKLAWDVCKVYVKAVDEIEVLEKERDFWMETVGYQQEKLNGLAKGSGVNRGALQNKEGEAPTDPNHSGNRGTRPPNILSQLRGPETKNPGEFKFTPYEPFALGKKDINNRGESAGRKDSEH